MSNGYGLYKVGDTYIHNGREWIVTEVTVGEDGERMSWKMTHLDVDGTYVGPTGMEPNAVPGDIRMMTIKTGVTE